MECWQRWEGECVKQGGYSYLWFAIIIYIRILYKEHIWRLLERARSAPATPRGILSQCYAPLRFVLQSRSRSFVSANIWQGILGLQLQIYEMIKAFQ